MRLEKSILKDANKIITTNRRVKELIISRYGNIDYNDVKINIYSDGALLHSKTVTNRKPFRLPNHSNHYDWQIEIIATSVVRDVALAGSMLELAKNG